MATEIADIPLQPGLDINDAKSSAGKILQEFFGVIRDQDGYQRAYHGRQIEKPNIWQVVIDWDSLVAHKKFMSSPSYGPFVENLMPIVDGEMESMRHALLSPHPPSAALSGTTTSVTEMINHYFAADISQSEQSSFESSMKQFSQVLEEKAEGFKGLAAGWVVEEVEHEGVEGKAKCWLSCLGWQSVEAHMAFRETKDFKDNVHLIRPDFMKAITAHHTKFTAV